MLYSPVRHTASDSRPEDSCGRQVSRNKHLSRATNRCLLSRDPKTGTLGKGSLSYVTTSTPHTSLSVSSKFSSPRGSWVNHSLYIDSLPSQHPLIARHDKQKALTYQRSQGLLQRAVEEELQQWAWGFVRHGEIDG
jgi:hypothetical protein